MGAQFVRPNPGGLLDGLPEPFGGSGLELLFSPEEIAGIGGFETGNGPIQDSRPMVRELRDQSHNAGEDDKYSGQESAGNERLEGDNKSLPQKPSDKTGGSVAGKIWNSPNSAIGMAYGGFPCCAP